MSRPMPDQSEIPIPKSEIDPVRVFIAETEALAVAMLSRMPSAARGKWSQMACFGSQWTIHEATLALKASVRW